jgi:hypothetical protein
LQDRRQKITKVSFYQWQKQMLANADALFDKPPKPFVQKNKRLDEEIQRKDWMIAIMTVKALEL